MKNKEILNNHISENASIPYIGSRSLVFGVGVNDSSESVAKSSPYYKTWTRMLERCYSANYHASHPTYRECEVSKDWQIFTNFKAWMETQDWEGKSLDKDIIEPLNKIYSKEKCVFVTKRINNLLTDHAAKKGKYPTGVCWCNSAKKFLSRISIEGKQKTIGYYDTEQEAEKAYLYEKSRYVSLIASQQKDVRIKNGLLRHAERIKSKCQLIY